MAGASAAAGASAVAAVTTAAGNSGRDAGEEDGEPDSPGAGCDGSRSVCLEADTDDENGVAQPDGSDGAG